MLPVPGATAVAVVRGAVQISSKIERFKAAVVAVIVTEAAPVVVASVSVPVPLLSVFHVHSTALDSNC